MVVRHAGRAGARARAPEDDARLARPSPPPAPPAEPPVDATGAVDERRRQLMAAAGHELKTPLSIVLGLCRRLLATGALEDASAGDVQRIRANAYVLLQRVDELLLTARLDSGRVEVERRDVDVARLVREIVEGFRSVAEARGQALAVTAPGALVAAVDEEKLLSVVSNLVANALKFAPAGGRVRCTVAEARRRLRIEVADSGPGVPRGLRREVFERYRQGAGAGARPQGSGLGLAIVRELVTLHGGTVTLSDAPEGGALFTVELPRAGRAPWRTGISEHPAPRHAIDVAERQRSTVERLRAELTAEDRRRRAAAGGPALAAGADAATALVVTADAELGAFVGELLADRWRVAHAVDALQATRRMAVGPHDVVLLDAAAGAGAVRTLRERLGPAPVLAIACDAEDVAMLMHAGAEDCVIKPFASEELLARLEALSARGRAAARREVALAGLDRAFDLAPAPMALIAPGGELLRVNGALCHLLGHAEHELVGRSVQELSHPDDLADEPDRPALVLHGRAAVDRRERRVARADGTYVRVRVSSSLVDDDSGRPRCLLWHLADAGDDDATAPGAVDLVGGAPGRRAFERALRHQIMRCERYAEQAALVRCSLDDLSRIRRRHGAEAADRLVQSIIDAVRGRLRDTDVVAFVGGHELAALLAHADVEAARIAAIGVREAVQGARIATAAGPVGTTASVGVSPVARAQTPGRAFLEAGLALEAARGR
jgi:PAS domain S-box-containing protein/diguanylate cyclase (GGDEF)-like protein